MKTLKTINVFFLCCEVKKTIEVVYFMDVSCNGKKLMTGWGTDGILYTFKVVPRKPIPLILPIGDEISHGKRKRFGDGDFTEPYSRLFKGEGVYSPSASEP
jgi:hypothetical protein